jgi:hypothetical protein
MSELAAFSFGVLFGVLLMAYVSLENENMNNTEKKNERV